MPPKQQPSRLYLSFFYAAPLVIGELCELQDPAAGEAAGVAPAGPPLQEDAAYVQRRARPLQVLSNAGFEIINCYFWKRTYSNCERGLGCLKLIHEVAASGVYISLVWYI